MKQLLKSDPVRGPTSRPIPDSVAETVRAAGRPLDPTNRSLMERSFGHDFSRVRVHTDARAASSARQLDAAAYTVGSTIAFGAGRYRPGTPAGQRLLAHELSHVVQQPTSSGQAPLTLSQGAGALDREADRAASRVGLGLAPARPAGHAPAGLIQRSPLSDSVGRDVGSKPTTEAVLSRLGKPDVQSAQADPDLDAELNRLLDGRAADIWLAQRVWHGLRAKPAAGTAKPRAIEAHFFAGATDRRALVIAGVHGSERQGMAVAKLLIDQLSTQQPRLTTIVVPSLFPDNAAKDNPAKKEFGSRETVDPVTKKVTETNRNFPSPDKDLAAARAAGSLDAKGNPILPENLLLLELIEKFHPERIISLHGTWDPRLAGVSYDRRALRADEEQRVASARVSSRPNYTAEGAEQATAELQGKLRKQLTTQADATDRRLSLATAAQIDRDTKGIAGRDDRVKSAALKPHASVAGNFDEAGNLNRAFWGGEKPEGVSLGSYAPPRGMSVFTVEPPIDRNAEDYRDSPAKVPDKVNEAGRRIELKAYADAVRMVLLGD